MIEKLFGCRSNQLMPKSHKNWYSHRVEQLPSLSWLDVEQLFFVVDFFHDNCVQW
jgi:hypothetical protein